MTLRKRDGSWSPAKITLLCTVVATIATVAIATPTIIDYGKNFAAVLQMPKSMEKVQRDVEQIKYVLNIRDNDNLYTTNKPMRISSNEH